MLNVMEDRLPRKRIDWVEVLYAVFATDDLREDFRLYKKRHKLVKSLNKCAFNFLLKSKGRRFIKMVRDCPDKFTMSSIIRVAHTSWIED